VTKRIMLLLHQKPTQSIKAIWLFR
jgi:hypothetical protein